MKLHWLLSRMLRTVRKGAICVPHNVFPVKNKSLHRDVAFSKAHNVLLMFSAWEASLLKPNMYTQKPTFEKRLRPFQEIWSCFGLILIFVI